MPNINFDNAREFCIEFEEVKHTGPIDHKHSKLGLLDYRNFDYYHFLHVVLLCVICKTSDKCYSQMYRYVVKHYNKKETFKLKIKYINVVHSKDNNFMICF